MTVRSGFFNSIGGDRKYDAARFAEYFGSFIGNGIFPEPENGLKVNANNNMTVTVQAGKAWINGYFLVNDDNYILTIENADGALNRIDRIVARYDVIDREIRLQIKKGTFSSSPTAPDMQRDADAYELVLANIYIAFGTTGIVQANITDLRRDANYCGIVDSLIAGNVNLLSERIDELYEILPNKLDKTGDGKDVTVTFTEAATEADIASGEKMSIMFGKILKKFKNIISGTTTVGKALACTGNADTATKLQTARQINGVAFDGTANITIADSTKAPTNHASTGTGYGIGTATNHGHVKVRNDLVGTETDGATVSPAKIKELKNITDSIFKSRIATLTSSGSWTVPIGVYEVDVLILGGGAGGNYASTGSGASGGGSGLGIYARRYPVSPGQVIPIVIGAGGIGVNGNEGTPGGYSRFGDLYAGGGLPGAYSVPALRRLLPEGVTKAYIKTYATNGSQKSNIFSFDGSIIYMPEYGEVWPPDMGQNSNGSVGQYTAPAGNGGSSNQKGNSTLAFFINNALVGKEYIIAGGAGGSGNYGTDPTITGGTSLGGGNGGSIYGEAGKNATRPACGGGGGAKG